MQEGLKTTKEAVTLPKVHFDVKSKKIHLDALKMNNLNVCLSNNEADESQQQRIKKARSKLLLVNFFLYLGKTGQKKKTGVGRKHLIQVTKWSNIRPSGEKGTTL